MKNNVFEKHFRLINKIL